MRNPTIPTILAASVLLALLGIHGSVQGHDWLQFRGADGASAANIENAPSEFDGSKNIAWVADLPGQGVSSPIVVGDRVVVTCSGQMAEKTLYVVCFDSASGKQLWKRRLRATGRTANHPSSANAAPTPCSDGELIFAFYSSNDLACFDLDGNLQWYRGLAHDYPKAGNDVGMSSSPVVVGDLVIVQVENQGDSFVAAIDKRTGVTGWQVSRPRKASWSSPVVYTPRGASAPQVIILGQEGVTGLDAATGDTVWELQGACNIIPSTAVHDGVAYVPFGGLSAIQPSEDGEVEQLWESPKLAPGAASPVLYDGRLFCINRSGVLKAASLESGDQLWQVRIGGNHWSTPVAASGKLYFFDQNGMARIVDVTGKGKVIHEHDFEEPIYSSPAAADGGDLCAERSTPVEDCR